MKTLPLPLLGNGMALGLLAALAAGCVTPALWKSTARREWKPNPPDCLVLLTHPDQQREVAVLFRQFAQVGATTECRNVGWRASRPPEQLALTPQAIGQLTNSCGERQSIPMFVEGSVPETASSTPPGYAVWHAPDKQLRVHIDGLPSGPFTLPTTEQKRQTAARIIVLPLAVAADTALVLGAIMAMGGAGGFGP